MLRIHHLNAMTVVATAAASEAPQHWPQRQRRQKATQWSKTAQTPTRGGSIATNVLDDGWGCRFLRVATKAILNGKGDANDNLQDDAATNIFSDIIGIDGH
jgi:hypothetical protein